MAVPSGMIYLYCNKQISENIERNKSEELVKNEPLKRTNKLENSYVENMSEEGRRKFKNQNSTAKKIESMEDAYQRISPALQKGYEVEKQQEFTSVKKIINEDLCWEKSLNEYDTEQRNKGLWARLYVENNGEEEKIKIAYIKYRAEQLIQQEKEK